MQAGDDERMINYEWPNEEEGSATREESNDVETEEMMEFTSEEIQMFNRNEDTEDVKKEKESEKKNSIEKQHREKDVRPKGFDKMIFVKDNSEYCETEDEV